MGDSAELHGEGWTRLRDGMPDWELKAFAERLHDRYCKRIVAMLEERRASWLQPARKGASGPGSHRPGGDAAANATRALKGSGLYIYATHPSQHDEEEDNQAYSGPRWYVSCMEAAMHRYSGRRVAPMPPPEVAALMWPHSEDYVRPYLTELGWTLVPEGSDPQVMHADVCWEGSPEPRQIGRGRFHHFAWKPDPTKECTTRVVPGAFTEGVATWDHYEKTINVKSSALVFDSELLHRGGPTPKGVGWGSTLTLQVCAGSALQALKERVSGGLMEYIQELGWEPGAAVEAKVDGVWRPSVVDRRDSDAQYTVVVAGAGRAGGLDDRQLRRRRPPRVGEKAAKAGGPLFADGAPVKALFEGRWYAAKVERRNADGSYRVIWCGKAGFTDGLALASLRPRGGAAAATPEPSPAGSGPKRRAGLDGGSLAEQAAPPPPAKRRKCQTSEAQPGLQIQELRAALFKEGMLEFPGGFPPDFQWELISFVEEYYARFNELVVKELAALRHIWLPVEDDWSRAGAAAAHQVSERLSCHGIAIYSPGPSQSQTAPFTMTGPRWYVSVTQAAFRHFGPGGAPAPPPALRRLLMGHAAEKQGQLRARGLGWTLAPPGSDPQALHADIWGTGDHARWNRTRWPHLLWKTGGKNCTTEIVPGSFTEGRVDEDQFGAIKRASAPAIIVDSEVTHRGAATASSTPGAAWPSTLSLELCTPSGWEAWESFSTGGTVNDPASSEDWRMLLIQGKRRRPLPLRPPRRISPAPARAEPAPWAAADVH